MPRADTVGSLLMDKPTPARVLLCARPQAGRSGRYCGARTGGPISPAPPRLTQHDLQRLEAIWEASWDCPGLLRQCTQFYSGASGTEVGGPDYGSQVVPRPGHIPVCPAAGWLGGEGRSYFSSSSCSRRQPRWCGPARSLCSWRLRSRRVGREPVAMEH